jgi:hypothetical protein
MLLFMFIFVLLFQTNKKKIMKNTTTTAFHLPNECYVTRTRNGWYTLMVPASPNSGYKVLGVKTSRKAKECTAHYHTLDVKGLLKHQRVYA